MSTTADSVAPALLFMTDISGYGLFTGETEISHSRYIIEELLQVLIDANELGMQVSAIEGDAILFYRYGAAPDASRLLDQVRRMFVNFHQHLHKYERFRICNCSACAIAHQLTLKMVAHYGEVTQNKVKSSTKIYGQEVITIHQLLKNGITHPEYALFTKPLTDVMEHAGQLARAWALLQRGKENYDSGPVSYEYLTLAPLLAQVGEPVLEEYGIDGATTHMIHSATVIEAPVELVFGVLVDLHWRASWMVGQEAGIEHINHKIIQEGSAHRCFSGGPILITHDYKHAEDVVSFTETNVQKTASTVFTLRRLSPEATELEADYFIKDNLFPKLFFILFMKNRQKKHYRKSWKNLDEYCQSLLQEGKSHPEMTVV
mgnify:CR=1 FL=1